MAVTRRWPGRVPEEASEVVSTDLLLRKSPVADGSSCAWPGVTEQTNLHGREAVGSVQGLAAAHCVGKTFLNKALSDAWDCSPP